MIDDIFTDIIKAQRELEESLEVTRLKEVPIYQTGTYSPTYLGSVTPGTTTYVTQVGEWTRIGRLVHLQGRIEWSAATGTGNAQFSLPFVAVNRSNLNGAMSIDNTSVTFANGTPQGLIQSSQSFFILRSPLTNAGSTTVQVEAAGIVNFSGVYEVA